MTFLKHCQDVCWVTFKTATTEIELQQSGQRSYWAHSPTNRHLPNLVRNMGLAFKVLNREKPDLVLSTGAGVGVPFLWAARCLKSSSTAFIESKTRLSDLSLSARMLYHSSMVDRLIVRFKELADLYPGVEYIPTETLTAPEIIANSRERLERSLNFTAVNPRRLEGHSWNDASEDAMASNTISRVNNTVFLIAPPALGCRELNVVLKFLPLSQEGIKRIVLDMSLTRNIDIASLALGFKELKTIQDKGIELSIWSARSKIVSAIKRLNLDRIFRIEDATLAVRW